MHRAFRLQSIYSQATATTKFSWITTSDSVIRVIFHCSAQSSGDLEIFMRSETPATRYDVRCCFYMRSKADVSQLNLPHATDNVTWKTEIK